MKYIYQFTLILFITFLGEFIYNIIPLLFQLVSMAYS